MRTKLLILFFITVLLSACRQNYKASNQRIRAICKKNIRTIQYINKDVGKGDITLNLYSDLGFNMIIQYRNNSTNMLTGTTDSISGEWSKKDTMLTLISADNNEIVYQLKTTVLRKGQMPFNIATYNFKSNKRYFFATAIDLWEKDQFEEYKLRNKM